MGWETKYETESWHRDVTEGGNLRFDPVARTYPLYSVFAQDTFEALPDRLTLTGGVKWEHNAFSGGDLQPSARVARHQDALRS